MFESQVYERKIYKLLNQLSKQRVKYVLQPGNVWVINKSLVVNEANEALLYTCQMRGWIEIMHDSVPHGLIESDGSFNTEAPFYTETQHIWKLSDSGWAVIQRRHFISMLSLILTAFGVVIAIVA